MQAACGRDRGLAVLGLAADLEPVRLEDRAGARPETRVVVDDQHSRHKHIVAQESARRSTASHTILTLAPARLHDGEPLASPGALACSRLDPVALEQRLVLAPLRADFHVQLEVDLVAEEVLDVRARLHPDLAHHRATLAD